MIDWNLIEKIASFADLRSAIGGYVERAGFDNFGMAVKFSRFHHQGKSFYTNYDYVGDWENAYTGLQNPAMANDDARVLASVHRLPAGAWLNTGETSYDAPMERLIPRVRHQLSKASDFGIKSGMTLPLQFQSMEWGFLSLSSRNKSTVREMEGRIIQAMYFAHFSTIYFDRNRARNKISSGLTVRELEVLKWTAIGKTSWEISLILNISERTVNFHLSQSAGKLGVRGRRAASTTAIALGLIVPS